MKKIGVTLLLGLLFLPAARRLEERKDAAIRTLAAILINPLVEAQTADAFPQALAPQADGAGHGGATKNQECASRSMQAPPKRAA